MRAHAGVPWIAIARARPFRRIWHVGVVEFVDRQVSRLALDREMAPRAEAARDGEIAWNIGGVVPVVELLLHRGGDVDAPHLEERRGAHRVVRRLGTRGEDLTITVDQIVAADE